MPYISGAMAFRDLPEQERGIQLLQRSLVSGRLAHGYLFTGDGLGTLEILGRNLAKTLNCLQPVRSSSGVAIDCCDQCLACRKIESGNHADVHWVRPESKSRVIVIDQMRELMQEIFLKPTEAQYKVGAIVAADRLNVQAANAFLKTLEEPPPRSILILLSTDPQRLLDTILSRCLRLSFAGETQKTLSTDEQTWLTGFTQVAAAEQKSLLGRYQLLDVLLRKLNQLKEEVTESLTARSPLQQYENAEKDLKDKWEDELAAAIEAEYRRQRADLLLLVQRWLRDIWIHALALGQSQKVSAGCGTSLPQLLNFPQISGTQAVARRISDRDAVDNLDIIENLQGLLNATNVQEALALEVNLLKLHL